MCMHLCTYISINILTCIYKYIYINYVYVYTHTHTHTHTHTLTCSGDGFESVRVQQPGGLVDMCTHLDF